MKRTIALPLAALAVIAGGLTIGATLPAQGVGAPTPVTAAADIGCAEDEPCWNCETMGNRICGIMPEPMRRAAWAAFDAAGGAEQLLANPHAAVTLTGYSTADPYAERTLTVQQLALPESGVWYVFTAQAI